MFIGRENELKSLNSVLSSKRKATILVYGKRRIGKSTLIAEAAKLYPGKVINHTCIKSSYRGNLALLSRSVSYSLNLPEIHFATLFDVFDFLKSRNEDMLIVLDEYQYFKASLKKDELDSQLQIIIDSLPDNVKLILCGSYITVMKELLEEENPLFGRFTKIYSIKEMDYFDSSKFFPDISVHNKISFYSIFGGSPFALAQIQPDKGLEWNITETILNKDSVLWTHIESVMLKEIQKAFDIRILQSLGNGKKKYSELVSILGEADNGNLDKQLKNLVSMETIKKTFPINTRTKRNLVFYEIEDNLMRFYFKYIFGNEIRITNIGEKNYYKNVVEKSIGQFIDFRFEDIARQYFSRLSRSSSDGDILDIGTYWYNDADNKSNGEFDCVVRRNDSLDIYEVKNFKRKMTSAEMEYEADKIRRIKLPSDINIGFICSGGFETDNKEYSIISGEDIYSFRISD